MCCCCFKILGNVTQAVLGATIIGNDWQSSLILVILSRNNIFKTNPSPQQHIFKGIYYISMIIRSRVQKIPILVLLTTFCGSIFSFPSTSALLALENQSTPPWFFWYMPGAVMILMIWKRCNSTVNLDISHDKTHTHTKLKKIWVCFNNITSCSTSCFKKVNNVN